MEKQEITLAPRHSSERPITLDIRWQTEKTTPQPLLIFVHGFKGFKDWGTFNAIADFFATQGFAFLKLNLSHNGTTPDSLTDFSDLEAFGNNNFGIELSDLARVLDWVSTESCPLSISRIGMIGHSRGGSIVLLKAAEDERVRAVATWAAVSDLVGRYAPEDKREQWEKSGVDYVLNGRTGQNMPLYFQLYQDTRAHAERYSVERAVRSLQIPLLVAHGKQDPAVDFAEGQALKSWHHDPVWLPVAEADHVFGGSHPFTASQLPIPLEEICQKTAIFFRNLRESD